MAFALCIGHQINEVFAFLWQSGGFQKVREGGLAGQREHCWCVSSLRSLKEHLFCIRQSINHKSCMLWRTASHFPKLPGCNLNISICMCLDFRSVADDMSKGCYATLWSHRSGTGAELPV